MLESSKVVLIFYQWHFRYSYFTRRGFDYSNNYGANDHVGSFTPRVHKCFRSNVNSCILDGEMVAWNPNESFLVSKGENVDVKNLTSDGSLIPCFFVFDILLLNKKVLTGLPLKVKVLFP